jgi:iron complex outermembrane recepter protein
MRFDPLGDTRKWMLRGVHSVRGQAIFVPVLLGCTALALGAPPGYAQSPPDLTTLSIEELTDVQVTSVSKRAESLGQAPSAIYLITRDEIERSGATNVAEILRLAPNLSVYETRAGGYVVTARGFNGNPEAQSFSNKLLVLIDGRSVYSPLFSGVYWDMQSVAPHDIDRIEVISGPGATLWGANAVNGVINITTRSAAETQGGLLDVRGGEEGAYGAARYGGRITDALAYRVFVQGAEEDDGETLAGLSGGDAWSRLQGGFRMDWTPDAENAVTLQGELLSGESDTGGAPDTEFDGANLVARWSRSLDSGGAVETQFYYDRVERTSRDGGAFTLDTFDLYVQHATKSDGAAAPAPAVTRSTARPHSSSNRRRARSISITSLCRTRSR